MYVSQITIYIILIYKIVLNHKSLELEKLKGKLDLFVYQNLYTLKIKNMINYN